MTHPIATDPRTHSFDHQEVPSSVPDRFALGTWGIAGVGFVNGVPIGYGAVREEDFHAVCAAAWDLGIRWVDTAQSYGLGKAYRCLGQWQRASGRAFRVATKVGRVYAPNGPISVLDRDHLVAEYEQAVVVLGPVPVVLVKDPPLVAIRSGLVFDLLDSLEERLEGVQVGLATHHLDIIDDLREVRMNRRIIELEYNAVQAQTCIRLAEAASSRGWTIWGMQPLAYGYLGNRRSVSAFQSDDFRSQLPEWIREACAAVAQSFEISSDSVAHGFSRAERAIAYCLCNARLDRIVVGPKHTAQLHHLAGASILAGQHSFSPWVQTRIHEALYV